MRHHFKLIKHKIVVLDEVYILFHFNIILKHKGMSYAKIGFEVYMSVQIWMSQFNRPHTTKDALKKTALTDGFV